MPETHGRHVPNAPEGSRGGRRQPRPVTAERLERAALAYLERFASSAANLRRILMRRVERSARLHGTDREEGARTVDALVERYLRAGLLDDARYAEARAESLRRRGTSRRALRAALAAKGIDAETAEAALARADEPSADPELAAACAFARRRRLGPYREPAERTLHRPRDLAALGRAGFSYDIARRIVEAEDAESLEAEAKES